MIHVAVTDAAVSCSVFGRLPRNGVTQNVGVPTEYVLTAVDDVTTDVWLQFVNIAYILDSLLHSA